MVGVTAVEAAPAEGGRAVPVTLTPGRGVAAAAPAEAGAGG